MRLESLSLVIRFTFGLGSPLKSQLLRISISMCAMVSLTACSTSDLRLIGIENDAPLTSHIV